MRPEARAYLHDIEQATVLIDQFLEDAVEFDVDAVCDGHEVLIGGIMEHIEEAGIHSGDSSCVLPPYSLVVGRGAGREPRVPQNLSVNGRSLATKPSPRSVKISFPYRICVPFARSFGDL